MENRFQTITWREGRGLMTRHEFLHRLENLTQLEREEDEATATTRDLTLRKFNMTDVKPLRVRFFDS